MDRNTVVGFVLIALILVGYSYFSAPTKEQLEAKKRYTDSIAQVEQAKKIQAEQAKIQNTSENEIAVTPQTNDSALTQVDDSVKKAQLVDSYGDFAEGVFKSPEEITIENDLLVATFSTKGGRPVSVKLKDYQAYGGSDLYLFDNDSSRFNLNFFYQNRLINTEDLVFEPKLETISADGIEKQILSMRLYAANKAKYIELLYGLGNGYVLDFDVNIVGLEELLVKNNNEIALNWSIHALSKEKGKTGQNAATTVFYKYVEDDVDYISEGSSEKINLEATTKWISFKQQFFSVVLIAENQFDKINGDIETKALDASKKYTKYLGANLTLTFPDQTQATFPMQMYLGPNHYQTLKKLDLNLQDQIDLGWGIFGWVNEWLVIPVFNFLDGFNLNYGLIILLLTIFIKVIIFPLTYKNYVSSAKQKVLKPEIDELNEKHKNSDPMKKQQALMALYRQAGVNPMAGCVPLLLQMPILYAMFRFFPSSIELRQEGFLWADDLSSYDSIVELSFNIPFYGSHVSLFAILMAASTFFYTRYNMQMTSASGPQAQQMKIMMYFMPFMLLFIFNSLSAGLSYYYFLANVVSMIQQWVIKKFFINEEAIHRKIQENKKKPVNQKKSGFQKRLEEMAKQRGIKPPTKK